MDWDGVRVFLAVARAGRVSVAARRLGVEHTTVSRRLAAFEAGVGVPLFHRTAAGYRLTPHGESILASAQAMERAAVEVGTRARESAGRASGRVRIAIVPELASHWLAPRLPGFRELHPAIDLQVVVGTRQLDLSRGEAELAVRSPRPRQTGLAAARIGRLSTGLYASRALLRGRRLWIDGAGAAPRLPLLVYMPGFELLQAAAWFQPVLAAGPVVLSSNSTHLLAAAARAGLGVAVLPRFVAAEESELRPVSPDVARQDLWLIMHPEFRRDPGVRATADFLRRAAAEVSEPLA